MPQPAPRLAHLADYAPLCIRALVGYRLVYGTVDNVLSQARMHEFAEFLQAHGFPWPLLSAHVSAYAQFIAGAAMLLGLFTRPAAALMLVNFAVALLTVHVGQPYLDNFDALAMLLGSAALLLQGAGALSLDRALARRAADRAPRGAAGPAVA